jgi:predicted ATPase
MKVSRIEIKDFQQFKDFELDLTYPEGHPKAGQPLDKVCFIGQSGTGKTTLLNWIWHSIQFTKSGNDSIDTNTRYNLEIDFLYTQKNERNTFLRQHSLAMSINLPIYYNFFTNDINGNEFRIYDFDASTLLKEIRYKRSILAIFFPTNTIENANEIFAEQPKQQNPLANIIDRKEIEKKIQEEIREVKQERLYNFGESNPLNLFKGIFFNIAIYEDERNSYSRRIADALLDSDDETITDLKNKFSKWKSENPNPLEKLGQLLNPILNKFGMEVNVKSDYKSSAELKFIEIKPLHNNIVVPYNIWSTGTKQIILTATPLFQLDTENTLVLFDEPERSLFPDIQRTLINYYTELAPEAQFFFATHSPIIASQFEPWEIVELKFNENGNVYREDYLKKDMPRHVDNYKFYPEYLRWDEVLTRVFDLDSEGNKREEILSMALYCQAKIEKMKEKGLNNGTEFEKIMQEYQKLAHKLGWNVYEKNS